MRKLPLLLAFVILAAFTNASASSFDLQFTGFTGVKTTGGNWDIRVQIRSVGGTFKLGTSNLVFTYDTNTLSSPTLLTAHNFSGGNYNTMSVTEPVTGRVSINIELFVAGGGTTVESTFMDVVTIRFTVVDGSGTAGLAWRTSPPNAVVVFEDDETTQSTANVLQNDTDRLIPVELTTFEAEALGRQVRVSWQTASETENLGFDVYRALASDGDYAKINQQRIPGAGTSAEAHAYEYTDTDVTPGTTYFYKLADVDFAGNLSFHGPVSAAVADIPQAYELQQNYPNPFNPSTSIHFDLPEGGKTRLNIYNTAGQLVRTLVNNVLPAGSHLVRWDGTDHRGLRVASGVYIYRLEAGDFVALKKLVLAK